MSILRSLARRIVGDRIDEEREDPEIASNTQFAGPDIGLVKEEDSLNPESSFYTEKNLLGASSSHSHLRRALKNAEAFANKGYKEQAIGIYKSLSQRVVYAPEVQKRLQSNVKYLEDNSFEKVTEKFQKKGSERGEEGPIPGLEEASIPSLAKELPRDSSFSKNTSSPLAPQSLRGKKLRAQKNKLAYQRRESPSLMKDPKIEKEGKKRKAEAKTALGQDEGRPLDTLDKSKDPTRSPREGEGQTSP